MTSQNTLGNSPILSAAQLARRWSKHESTISRLVRAGALSPVLRAGKQMSFALSDVLKIESGHANENPEHDFIIHPLSNDGRSSPKVLIDRVNLASQALDAAAATQSRRGADVSVDSCNNLRLVSITLRHHVTSGGSAYDLPLPCFGPREVRGVCVSDPESPPKLCELAYGALRHLLMSSEALSTLCDLGPRGRQAFFESIENLETHIDKVKTQ